MATTEWIATLEEKLTPEVLPHISLGLGAEQAYSGWGNIKWVQPTIGVEIATPLSPAGTS